MATTESANLANDDPIVCPLCGYDLRGLPEPRCPECGTTFPPEHFSDPAKRIHPYLFEHHPHKNFSSFARTLFHGFNPSRFWKSLHAAPSFRLRRLLIYWLIILVPTAAAFSIQYVESAMMLRRMLIEQELFSRKVLEQERQLFVLIDSNRSTILTHARSDERAELVTKLNELVSSEKVTVAAAQDDVNELDAMLPPHLQFFESVFESMRPFVNVSFLQPEPIAILATVALTWPISLLGLLFIFSRRPFAPSIISLKVLVRVVVYCTDVLIWPALVAAGVAAVRFWLTAQQPTSGVALNIPEFPETNWVIVLLLLIALVVMTHRLSLALRDYVRIEYARIRAIIMQGLAFLILMAVLRFEMSL